MDLHIKASVQYTWGTEQKQYCIYQIGCILAKTVHLFDSD